MKRLRSCALTWLLSLVAVCAQVTVEVQPEQKQYLPGEKLVVQVRITNLSGQPLALGAEDDWLKFDVESRSGFVVSERQKLAVQGEFTLDSSKTAIKRVDLAPGFDLGQLGRYTVMATVRVKEWQREFTSKPALFDVVLGTKLWEQEFGLPLADGAAGRHPEVRKYLLQQVNYLKELKLYLRITDAADTNTIRVLLLGQMISFSRPEPQVDKRSNLHLLWQTGARSFAYRVLNPSGEIIVSQTHDYIGTRPRLVVNEQGDIMVRGGQRRFSREDLPARETAAPATAPAPADAPTPADTPTALPP